MRNIGQVTILLPIIIASGITIPVYATPALFCRQYLVTTSNINAVHTVSAPPAVFITEAVVHIVQRIMAE